MIRLRRDSDGDWMTDYAPIDAEADQCRAYDVVTGWSGPARETEAQAQADAEAHNAGCICQGGYGAAIVVRRDGDRLQTLDGRPVWPPDGQTHGAAQWV